MMKKTTLLLWFLAICLHGLAQRVAIVGVNHDDTTIIDPNNTNAFTFLALEDLSVGEVYYFTNHEYNTGTGTFDVGTGVRTILQITVTQAIPKGNVVYINETAFNSDAFTINASAGNVSTALFVVGGSSVDFYIQAEGDTLYMYTDTDTNPTNGVTEVHSIFHTGIPQPFPTPDIIGGNITAQLNAKTDYPNAILVDGFPDTNPNGTYLDRTEYKTSVVDRTDVNRALLENPQNYVSAQLQQDLSITVFTNFNLDGSNPVLTVTSSQNSVAEASGTAINYTFELDPAQATNTTVDFSVSGSAIFNDDYSQSGATTFTTTTGSVVINSGATTASITITPIDDANLEPDEMMTLSLTTSADYDIGNPSSAATEFTNDDTMSITPMVAITGLNPFADIATSFDDGAFSFVALTSIPAGEIVYFTTEQFNKNTLSFNDFFSAPTIKWTAPTGGVVRGEVIVVAETNTPNALSVSCDSGTCGTATTIVDVNGFFITGDGQHFFAYTDTDDDKYNGISTVQSILSTLSDTPPNYGGPIPADQDASTLYLGTVVVDDFANLQPNRVEYKPSLRGTTTVDLANFQNTANWDYGAARQDLSTVPFNNIIISEGSTNPSLGLTISGNDTVAEDSGASITYRFTLSAAATADLTINFDVSGTAAFNTDYTVTGATSFTETTGSVTLLNGQTEVDLTVTPTNDGNLEADETVQLNLAAGTGYDGGSPNSATGTMTNDDLSNAMPSLAILGANHNDTDALSFVVLETILPGTEFYITNAVFDNSDLAFETTQPRIRFTSPDTCILKGSILVFKQAAGFTIDISCTNGTGADCGTVATIDDGFSVPDNGGRYYVYQDNDADMTNGVTQIHNLFHTGGVTPGPVFYSGGTIPATNNPKNTFVNAVVTEGFPDGVLPNRVEFKETSRNTEVIVSLLEDLSNWDHAQANQDLSLTSFTINPILPQTIYVNVTAPNGGDGTSWATAYNTLQEALANMSPCAADEVWVAEGVYNPTTTTDRTIAFVPPANARIYGGFEGVESNLSERDWHANPTILSGEIGGAGNADDSYSVVHIANSDITVDGVIIESGSANASGTEIFDRFGAGIYISDAADNNQITNCIIRNNNGVSGVGLANFSTGTATVTNTLFHNNTATHSGGAVGAEAGTTNLVNCTVVNNIAPVGEALRAFNGNFNAVNTVFASNNGNSVFSVIAGSGAMTYSYSVFDVVFPATVNTTNNGNSLENTNPLFTDSTTNDFTLQSTSPAINIGDNSANSEAKDLAGNNRIFDSIIDIGAYESQTTLSNPSFDINAMTVYPIPTRQFIYIESDALPIDRIAVYNLLGKEVFQSKQTDRVDVSYLESGMYLLKLYVQGSVRTYKILKD